MTPQYIQILPAGREDAGTCADCCGTAGICGVKGCLLRRLNHWDYTLDITAPSLKQNTHTHLDKLIDRHVVDTYK